MERAEVEFIWAELSKGFLKPQVAWITSRECSDAGVALQGWYHRLSAPGYLDCTDWTGPFQFRADAEEDCVAVYGDDIEYPPVVPAQPADAATDCVQSAIPGAE